MLIVVAIIAILIAVSIPLVNKALERARDATDEANMRSAKAEAILVYLGQAEINGLTTYVAGSEIGKDSTATADKVYYDAQNGRLTTTKPTGTAVYGKCIGCNNTHTWSANTEDHKGKVIAVHVKGDGTFECYWE